jgi:hypothetical protein
VYILCGLLVCAQMLGRTGTMWIWIAGAANRSLNVECVVARAERQPIPFPVFAVAVCNMNIRYSIFLLSQRLH